jgi:diguanylate cyclase (GGDEF)-like protein
MDTPDSNRRRRGDDRVDAPAATPAVEIPDGDMTPAAEAAILELVAEIDRLKEEIAATRKRIVFLENLADEDPLTPVANRRAFIRELTRVAALARRHGTPSSVLYFDIDGMKTINDRFGHAAGDRVLVAIADSLVANVRASDLVGRLGGDEFGIILAHTDDAAARGKAAVLAKGIAELGIEAEGGKVPVSATFGISAITGVEDAEAALAAADKAMYERKQERSAGRSAGRGAGQATG